MVQDQDYIRLQRLAEGDDVAFTDVYNQYWESLFKYVIRILPDEDEVADVVQETFVTFWELRTKLQRVKSIKAYLFIIARNKSFKRFQANLKNRGVIEQLVQYYAEADECTEEQVNTKVLLELIDAEIDQLPERMRKIFIMSRKEHLSYKEIAERLKISDLTVKKQINNSLKHLRLKIDDEYIPYLTLLLLLEFFVTN